MIKLFEQFNNEQEIHDICKEYKIKNYTINSNGSIDVNGNVRLSCQALSYIPLNFNKGYYKSGQVLPGKLSVDMMSQVKSYADPISQKVQAMMSSIDKMVTSLTAFWDTTATSEIEQSMKQVKIAIEESNLLLFMVDVTTDVTDLDSQFASILRKSKKPVIVVVNKVDTHDKINDAAVFYTFGFENLFTISSATGSGTLLPHL
jgi:ribosome-interacting GTPase 1